MEEGTLATGGTRREVVLIQMLGLSGVPVAAWPRTCSFQTAAREDVMREIESRRRQIGGQAAFFGGLMIAALAFSAGVLGARSHKPVDSPAVRTETSSLGAGTYAMEPRWIKPSDQDLRERKVPGHSELDLQLD
jgi:hypothetical protein